ncbi:MAG: ATP-binding protein, partial [Acidobacteria bacterium]|nr:ATP-binding protein [Acidobacteriota bacterium]
MPELHVTSHVARDLLQTAQAFGDVLKAVWEYVANGLEYVKDGVNPKVQVNVFRQERRIEIIDNGRGMDWTGLQNFFTMHGENIDRLTGRPGRGRFGTGKCAAFGIARCLRVATIRNGLLCSVELRREAIEACSSGSEIPVTPLANNIPTDQPEGTLISIGQVSTPIDPQKIIWLIQRHLTHWARNASVYVGDHFCQPRIPEANITQTFSPTDKHKAFLGDVSLNVKAAAGLNDYSRGIAIYSKGIWHATRLEG